MSRILVVGINYAPESIGTGKYTSEMCEWLALQGHTVRVITAPPYYPAWATWPEYRTLLPRREIRNGVDVLRCPIWVPEQPRGATRILHLGSFALSAALGLVSSLTWRPHVVINIAPTLASAPAAWLYAKMMGARSWLHIQDFEVDAAMDMGIVRAGRLRRCALALERWLINRFDRVSAISERMVERLEQKGVARAKRVLFPNGVDIGGIRPLAAPSPYRAELQIPQDAVVALYSGNMGLKQGLDVLASAALSLQDQKSLYFVFGGDGPGRTALEAACHGLPNVRFLGLQPAERLSEWLGLADIHLLPQRADVADLVMPSKLTGMLASGRPTLATAAPGTGVAKALAKSGVVTEPGDANRFAAALKSLALDPAQRRKLGEAAREQAENSLSARVILSRFHQELTSLIGNFHQMPAQPAATSSERQDTP